MNISIKIDNTNNKIDVSSEVDINTIQLGERSDFSFERGGFTLITSQITHNIPPYSLCKIDSDIYCIYSEAQKNLVTGKWIHTCHLLALESLLECYILGSKAYRNLGRTSRDSDIMSKTLSLINRKYYDNVEIFQFYDDTQETLLYIGHEYTFGTGTTLYEVVRQIAVRNNLQFRLEFSSYHSITWDTLFSNLKYLIRFYDPTTAPTLAIPSNSPILMNVSYSQDSNNYCKRLETEARNVVDRDKDAYFTNLTPRTSNGIAINDDTAEIILPTAVEGITKFEVIGATEFKTTWNLPNDVIRQALGVEVGVNANRYCLYQDLINANVSYGTITNVFEYIYDNLLKGHIPDSIIFPSYAFNVYLEYGTYSSSGGVTYIDSKMIFYTGIAATESYPITTDDYTDRILEEAEWLSLNPQDQPKYVAYKKGTNNIYNMNASYKDDFWGNILGYTTKNFLYETTHEFRCDLDSTYYAELTEHKTNTYPTQNSYNVQCVPITNPIVVDTKNQATMLNESSQKNYGRSYQMGDNNNLPIYLDAMIYDMDKQNETLGLIEASVDIDFTSLVTIPTANSEITLFGETFYVYSLSKRFTTTKKFMTLNLSRNRYKICDAIGVDYQFNSTKFPLENIVDRPIYMSVTDNNLYTALTTTNDAAYVKIQFYDYQPLEINTLVKRLAVQIVGDSCYCYVETLDNIVFDTKAVPTNGVYACDNMPYVDDNGECEYIRVEIFTTKSVMSVADSYKLPDTSALANITIENQTYVTPQNTLNSIYKDVAERLTFTIEVKKSN